MIKKVMLLSIYVVANAYGMEQRLLDALRKEDVDQMRELIVKEKADPNSYKSELGLSLLHFAVLCDKMRFVELLASNGANLSARDTKGWAPIHFAAATGNVKALKKLLEYDPEKKQIHLKNTAGETPLLLALREGKQEVAQALYSDHGTDLLVDL